MDQKETGAFISKLRKEKGYTQRELAEILGVSDKTVSKWETGKGYPDIEQLLSLSEEFSVSVNELLYGRRIMGEKEEYRQNRAAAENEIARSYLRVSKDNHKKTVLIIVLSLIFAAMVTAAIVGFCLFRIYHHVMGSDYCTVKHDYSALTLYGKNYVPLKIPENSCIRDRDRLMEARVEGTGFLTKLFFEDSIYAVKGCVSNDIVYLQTEYDDLLYHYFCIEPKAEYYTEMYENADFSDWYVELYTKDWDNFYEPISDDLRSALTALREENRSKTVTYDFDRSKGEESVCVCAFAPMTPFVSEKGEILFKDGEYFWYDYRDRAEGDDFSEMSKTHLFELSDDLDAELDRLFSQMFL